MTKTATTNDVRSMMADLRQHLFAWLPLPTAFLAFYILLLVNRQYGVQPAPIFLLTGWVALVALGAQAIQARYWRFAIHLYLFGMTVAACALIWSFSISLTAMALVFMIVVLGMNLAGARVTLGLAGLMSLTLAAVTWRDHLPNTVLLVPLGVTWLATLVAWVSNYNLLIALEWAWNSYVQAQASTDAARRHRGELARALKDLDSAYYRLERYSVQLAHARNIAEEARRAKQQFVANVSHELRTPLNIIIGFSEAIVLSPESYGVKAVPRPFMGDVNRIYRSAQHLKNLIDDVLDLSKVDAQQLPLFVERVSIDEVIGEAADMIEPLAVQKGLKLDVAAPATLSPVLLDRLRIRQVLLNLLSNAVRFTESGRVTVTARRCEQEIRVDVADTGPGIPPKTCRGSLRNSIKSMRR